MATSPLRVATDTLAVSVATNQCNTPYVFAGRFFTVDRSKGLGGVMMVWSSSGSYGGDPVPEGEVGEVVVTTLNPGYPLIRFGTGDLSALLPGTCPTGRTNQRIRGWLGRADQTTKIRGRFVHPAQVADIARRFPEVVKARLVVTGEMANDAMTLKVETLTAPQGLDRRISDAIRDVTKLRGDVELVSPGSLPNDGKVIEDARSYK